MSDAELLARLIREREQGLPRWGARQDTPEKAAERRRQLAQATR